MSNEINLTPISNNIITTAFIQKKENTSGIVTMDSKPQFLQVQQVLAIGPNVEFVKEGDWVYIDYTRYVKHVKVKSQIRAGVGGEDMIKEQFVPPLWVAPGDDEGYFKITDREIEGVIHDLDKLPKEMTSRMSAREFEDEQMRIAKEVEEGKKAADKQVSDKMHFEEKKGPAIVAEGIYRG